MGTRPGDRRPTRGLGRRTIVPDANRRSVRIARLAYSVAVRLAIVTILLLVVTAARADQMQAGGRRGQRVETDLFVAVPLAHDTRVVFPFGGSHHAVPGLVTINKKAPYFCVAHRRGFGDRVSFVEHLGVVHGLTDREIPAMVLVAHDQVRYVGD